MQWTATERRLLASLETPADIQHYLDALAYDERGGARSPRRVMESEKAQCYSGALFAAAALRELGFPPRIMWMDAVEDDGHCIAVYEVNGLWDSVAKSNFTGIRSREPVYTYEALSLSYFDFFFNQFGKRTMRAFTVPIELERFEQRGWRFSGGQLLYVDRAIDNAPRAWQLSRAAERKLSRVSKPLMDSGLMGSNPEGLWKP